VSCQDEESAAHCVCTGDAVIPAFESRVQVCQTGFGNGAGDAGDRLLQICAGFSNSFGDRMVSSTPQIACDNRVCAAADKLCDAGGDCITPTDCADGRAALGDITRSANGPIATILGAADGPNDGTWDVITTLNINAAKRAVWSDGDEGGEVGVRVDDTFDTAHLAVPLPLPRRSTAFYLVDDDSRSNVVCTESVL